MTVPTAISEWPLPIEVEAELDDARAVQLRAQDAEGLRRLEIHCGVGELDDVAGVEELGAEGDALALGEAELAGDREIDVPPRETAQLAAGAAGAIERDHGRAKGGEYCSGVGAVSYTHLR